MNNNPILIFGIPIELINLGFTVLTTLCALLISVIALSHSVRPRIKIKKISTGNFYCRDSVILQFRVVNNSYWFANPMVVGLVIYCNFHEAFKLLRLRYGSRQENTDDAIKLGKENMQYFKVENIQLGASKIGEEFHVDLVMPEKPGKYRVKFSAYSGNGVSYRKVFNLKCLKKEVISVESEAEES